MANAPSVPIPGKLFVGKLHPEADNDDLKAAFAQFGTVDSAAVARDKVTKGSRKFGFVTYRDYHSIDKALAANKVFVKGSAVDFRRNTPRDPNTNQLLPQVDKIFVGRVSESATESNFKEYFSKYGTVLRVSIFSDRGFAFVTFDAVDCVNYLMANHEPFHIINGRKCEVKRAEDRGAVKSQQPPEANGYPGHPQHPAFRPPAPMGGPGSRPPLAALGQRPPLFGGMLPPRGRAPLPAPMNGRPPIRPPVGGLPPRGLIGARPPLRGERGPPPILGDERGPPAHRNMRDRAMDGAPPIRPPGGPLRGAPGPPNAPLRNILYGRPGDRDDRRPPLAHRDGRDMDHRDRDGPNRRDSDRRGASAGPPNAPPRAPAPGNRGEPLLNAVRRDPPKGPIGRNGLSGPNGARPGNAFGGGDEGRRDSQYDGRDARDSRNPNDRDFRRDSTHPSREQYTKPAQEPYTKTGPLAANARVPPAAGAPARPSVGGSRAVPAPSARGPPLSVRRNEPYGRPPAAAPAHRGPPENQYKAYEQDTTRRNDYDQNKAPAQGPALNMPVGQTSAEAAAQYDNYGQQPQDYGQQVYGNNAHNTNAAAAGGYQDNQANNNGFEAYDNSAYTQPEDTTVDHSGYYNGTDGQYNHDSNAYAQQASAQSNAPQTANAYGQQPAHHVAPATEATKPPVGNVKPQEYTQDYNTYGYQQPPVPQNTAQSNAQHQWPQQPDATQQATANAPQDQAYDQSYGQQPSAQPNTQAPQQQQGYAQQYAYGAETAPAYSDPTTQGYGQTQAPATAHTAAYTQQQPATNAYGQQGYAQQGYGQQQQPQQGYAHQAAAKPDPYAQAPVAQAAPPVQDGGYGARTAAPAAQATANQNEYGSYQQQGQGYGAQYQARW
ncbi:hypothetical protein SARC_04465 [Sphaeroforma arctica JP610]|uniref:RRM domain-containing protein n=1 Tax=Sphaeroforma arctica JP610 TaxID=667725 RepID=A0A0L0G369_9EUKA|nr:hypothetical protein SARC_04465 [Sphaeroforma arctica JP610]KNC83286.1 hypothetical protein SARC_04465 [Sphaeroforma arctica JP610]|eukprot:XP_014157188.1 hypothetical protein SARC_04465 [Sphaeroforma arctica JP610]